jgi:2-oxoglutarate dehydrogenase E2 component (dihydrolipoamide succinyltransferase)
MMREIKVPRLAESVSEGVVVAWLKPDGAMVRVDEPVVTLETDKAAVEIPSEFTGVLHHARALGDRVEVGDVLARVEEGAVPTAAATPPPVPAATAASGPRRTPSPTAALPTPPKPAPPPAEKALSPAVRRLVEEHGLDPAQIRPSGPGGRLLKEDVQRYIEARKQGGTGEPTFPMAGVPAVPAGGEVGSPVPSGPVSRTAPSLPAALAPSKAPTDWALEETERAVPMSRIRLRIAERLVKAQQAAAILTTFNEVDMSVVMALRERYRDEFERRHGVRLSYMSFFTRACVQALDRYPELNAEIRGTDIVYRRHVHMGIAVGTERGLVVPVVRAADQRSFADLEREIARLSVAARGGSLTLDELSGGTFTISNGGVYGSLLSTPILNFPQSGILGMHKILKRPIAIDDQVVIRPMMYLALSYDHRIVDGEQAVSFLISVRDRLEDPERMLIEV